MAFRIDVFGVAEQPDVEMSVPCPSSSTIQTLPTAKEMQALSECSSDSDDVDDRAILAACLAVEGGRDDSSDDDEAMLMAPP